MSEMQAANVSHPTVPSRDELDPQREIFNLEEAARFLGVSVKTFNKVLHSENLPARKIGREWKFSRSALVAWVGAGRSENYYKESAHARSAAQSGGYNGSELTPHVPAEPKSGTPSRTSPRAGSKTDRRTSGWRLEMD